MAEMGVNADPRVPGIGANEVAATGATWVRTVLRSDHDLRPFIEECAALGVQTLPVVARESLPGWDPNWRVDEYRAAAQAYGDSYRDLVSAIQVGNEPDLDSSSSWMMSATRVNRMLGAFRAAFPNAFLIGPGLASGNPSYVDGLDLAPVDRLALHPYGRAPAVSSAWTDPNWIFGPARSLLDLYARFGKPFWISEFGGPSSDFQSEEQRGAYYGEMARTLAAHSTVEVAFAFCLDHAMVDGFGLSSHGQALPAFEAFRRAAFPVRGVARRPLRRGPSHEFRFGFKVFADAHPEVGQPVEDEKPLGEHYTMQMTTAGVLLFSAEANAIHFLPGRFPLARP